MNNTLPKRVRALSNTERQYFSPHFQAKTIEKARIIEGCVPFWLRQCMCAVVVGERIYLRRGVYQENTVSGITLLAHELTHVEQFLTGMTIMKYLWACRCGYRKNSYEIEAYQRAREICRQVLDQCQTEEKMIHL